MNARFSTWILVVLLSLLIVLVFTACDDKNSSSDEYDNYKLEDYYHLAESGTWEYTVYQDDEVKYYDSYEMQGIEHIAGRDAYKFQLTTLKADSSLYNQNTFHFVISSDSLLHLYPTPTNLEYWELEPEVSLWADKEIGDTIVFEEPFTSLSPTYHCVLIEKDTSFTVDGATYDHCRAYEIYGESDMTNNYCEILSFYAKDIGLVYKRIDTYFRINHESRLMRREIKISDYPGRN